MSDNKCMDKRCEGCNPHFPGQLKRCPTCNGLCSNCLKRNKGKNVATKAAATPAPVVVQEKKKHTGLTVALIIIGILLIIGIVIAILYATGVIGVTDDALWNISTFIGVSVEVTPAA